MTMAALLRQAGVSALASRGLQHGGRRAAFLAPVPVRLMHWNARAAQWNVPRGILLQAGAKEQQQQGSLGAHTPGYARMTPVRWSSSKAAFEKDEDQAGAVKAPEPPKGPASGDRDAKAPAKRKWGLREFTMFASFLCAIDCTVFPVLLTVLPAAEMLTPENSAMIHHASHLAALYVVLPIGTTTTITNFMLNRNLPLAALSTVGLSLILGSNADFSFLPAIFHESRVLNTLGCGMLIASSYLGHRHGEHDHDGKPKKSCHGPSEEPATACHGKDCSKEPQKEAQK